MYKIIITKEIENPNYDPEATRDNYRYGRDINPEVREKMKEVPVLSCELTNEEFVETKKAIINVIK